MTAEVVVRLAGRDGLLLAIERLFMLEMRVDSTILVVCGRVVVTGYVGAADTLMIGRDVGNARSSRLSQFRN